MTYEELQQLLNDPDFDENQFNDFKSEVLTDKAKDLARDICAFANALGGRLFIGIRDNKTFNDSAIQYPIRNWESMDSEALSNATRLKIAPHLSHNLYFTVTPVKRPQQNTPVLIIEIEKSQTIYGYRPANDKSWEFWHRLDRQNSPMGAAEIVDKCLGLQHFQEQLTISNEFCDLLIRRVGMITVAIHMAYQNQKNGKFPCNEQINETSLNNISHLKSIVISEAGKTYTNLSSLAFLSANINSKLKQLAISLTNKLATITSDNSIWNISDSVLDKLKENPVISSFDVRAELLQESNALIKDYQSLLAIKEEIKEQMTQSIAGL